MPGTNNFIAFNPTGANMETDAQYAADALRSGGLANPSIFTSILGNKLFYQLSTFVAAFAQAMAAKNYNMSDASLATLAGVLANVMTLADMSVYAPLASPVLTGSPVAPTPGGGDNSTKIATTAFVNALLAAYATQSWVNSNFSTLSYVNGTFAPLASPSLSGNPTAPTQGSSDNSTKLATTAFVKNQAFQQSLGFVPVQQGGGTSQATNKVYIGWSNNGTGLRVTVDATDIGAVCFKEYFSQSASAYSGWTKLPNGLSLNWGTVGTGGGYTAGASLSGSFSQVYTQQPAVVLQNSNGGSTSDFALFNCYATGTGGFNYTCNSSGVHAAFFIAIGT